MDYYQELNATLPMEQDKYFVDMVKKTWRLPDSSHYVPQIHLKDLEETMYEKVRQRTNPKEDEGIALLRAIKYIDIADTKALDLEQFSKLLISIGCKLSNEDMKTLFLKFADKTTFTVNPEKIANYFTLKSSGNYPNIKPKFKIEAEPPSKLLSKIKQTLLDRGPKGMRELGKVFKEIDTNGNGRISRHEFGWAMKQNGHNLTQEEFEYLFRYFDKNKDDAIDYSEFVRGVRGELNERRRAVVSEVFHTIDMNGRGQMTFEELMNLYNVQGHPKFVTGVMTKKEILDDFLSQWSYVRKEKVITFEDFLDYYSDMGASITRDDYFELMVRNDWRVPGPENPTEEKRVHFGIGQ